MKPISYRVQNGCHNCKFSFLEREIDCQDKLFCEYNGKMPLYSEGFDALTNHYLWREVHEVEPHGICKYWQECL